MPSSHFSPPSLPPRIDPAAQLARAADIAGAVRLTDVTPTSIRWLWPGRIPLGRITLLVSDPGLGKSLLALDIAARVSSGTPWPDDCSRHTPCAVTEPRDGPNPLGVLQSTNDVGQPPADAADGARSVPATQDASSVLLLTAEDNLADTVRPRLEALGADCNRILAMSTLGAVPESPGPKYQRDSTTLGDARRFALNRDLARLRNLLNALPDCRLLVIDPITEFLGGANEQSNADVRALLGALTKLARDHNIAVLIVSHLRKKDGAAIYRTMGSLAFVASTRAAWMLVKDPAESNKRLLLPLKNNLAPDVAGLAYTIESSADGRTPVLNWSVEPVNLSLDAVLVASRSRGRPDDERQAAIQWLREQLSKGPRPASEIREEAEANGIGYGTLRRAFHAIRAKADRLGPFPFGQWHWMLPHVDAQKSGVEFCASTNFVDDFLNRIKVSLPPTPDLRPPTLTPDS